MKNPSIELLCIEPISTGSSIFIIPTKSERINSDRFRGIQPAPVVSSKTSEKSWRLSEEDEN